MLRITTAVLAALALLALSAATAGAVTVGTSKGVTYVFKPRPIAPAVNTATAAAKCPKKTVLTGGGFDISGVGATSYISESSLSGKRKWVTSGGHSDLMEEEIASWAMCTKKDKGKIFKRSDKTDVGAGPTNGAGVSACLNGHVLSGGVRPMAAPGEFRVNASYPGDSIDMDTNPDDVWGAFVFHVGGMATKMFVDALCIKGKAPKYVTAEKMADEPETRLKARCPGGKVVVGGGARNMGDAAATHMTESRPFDTRDKGTVPDNGWEVTYAQDQAGPQTYRVTAVCR